VDGITLIGCRWRNTVRLVAMPTMYFASHCLLSVRIIGFFLVKLVFVLAGVVKCSPWWLFPLNSVRKKPVLQIFNDILHGSRVSCETEIQ
jgi:hypothetical protein